MISSLHTYFMCAKHRFFNLLILHLTCSLDAICLYSWWFPRVKDFSQHQLHHPIYTTNCTFLLRWVSLFWIWFCKFKGYIVRHLILGEWNVIANPHPPTLWCFRYGCYSLTSWVVCRSVGLAMMNLLNCFRDVVQYPAPSTSSHISRAEIVSRMCPWIFEPYPSCNKQRHHR